MCDSASGPEDKREHLLRMEWIKAVPLNQAFRERGLFGNQNTVARPRTGKWTHTVERLKQRFGIGDQRPSRQPGPGP